MFEIIDSEKMYENCKDNMYKLFLCNFIGCLKVETTGHKKVGYKKTYRNIKNCCNDQLVRECVSKSKVDNKKWQIVIVLIKYKLYILLYILLSLKLRKDYSKRNV